MLKPFRLFDDSVKNFAVGLGPALLMAFVCLAIQLAVPMLLALAWNAIVPPTPPADFVQFMNGLFEPTDWRDGAVELLGYTVGKSILFFFHALVALILTAWLLRRSAGFNRMNLLRRALRGAGLFTCGAALVFAAGFLIDDLLPATRYIRFDFTAAATLAVWFGGTALLLPARLMGYEPATASGLLRTTLIVALVLVPWFFLSEIVGRPIRHCRECWGLFEGGLFSIPILGAYLLGLTVSSAAVSAAACMPTQPQAATPTAA